jgi:hypothetical protein
MSESAFNIAELPDPYTVLFAALMGFILGARLFSADTHITKKVRTAR